MSNRGIIAVAVFEEGYVEPVRIEHHYYHNDSDDFGRPGSYRRRGLLGSDDLTYKSICRNDTKGVSTKCSNSINESSDVDYYSSDSLTLDEQSDSRTSSDLKSLASVGAGSYTAQKISYTTGLKQPVFVDTLRVKYVWWDDLKAKLAESNYMNEHPNGFPGDPPRKMINLKSTPRIDTPQYNPGIFRRAAQEETWTRF